jgi:hypothetical protein
MVVRNPTVTGAKLTGGVELVSQEEYIEKQMTVINAKLEENLDEVDRYFWEGMQLYYHQIIWQISFRGEQIGSNK